MKNHEIKFGNRKIGINHPTFIIAEAGVNYNNNLSLAFQMIDTAKQCGADAIKFQTFKTNSIVLKKSTKPKYQNPIKNSYYKILKNLEPSFEDQKKIFHYCKKKKIIFLSTPYDKESVDFLNLLGIVAFKISSSDLSNHLLLEHVLQKRKPLIISTGLSSFNEIDQTMELVKKYKMKNKIILLQTTSNYPTNHNEINLRVIPEYIKRYDVLTGLSDHTVDAVSSIGAVVLGARVLEKHFTLNRKLPGPDQSSSLEPNQVKTWIKKIRLIEDSLGSNNKKITYSEKHNLSMRKILVIKTTKKDTIIKKTMLDAKRGTTKGILPTCKNIEKILGKTLKKNITRESVFTWDMI